MKQSSATNFADGDPWMSRGPRLLVSREQGSRFPMPKSPKVEIPVFKGEGDVLNWLYQIDHLFSLHDALVEDRVEFYCILVES